MYFYLDCVVFVTRQEIERLETAYNVREKIGPTQANRTLDVKASLPTSTFDDDDDDDDDQRSMFLAL